MHRQRKNRECLLVAAVSLLVAATRAHDSVVIAPLLNRSVVDYLLARLDVRAHHDVDSLADVDLFSSNGWLLESVHAFAQSYSVRPLKCWFSTARMYNSSFGAYLEFNKGDGEFDGPHRDSYEEAADPSAVEGIEGVHDISVVIQLTEGRHLFVFPQSWSAHESLNKTHQNSPKYFRISDYHHFVFHQGQDI